MTRFIPLTVVLSVLLTLGLVGCGSSNDTEGNQAITVFAAESLKAPFTDLAERFKTDNPGTSIEFTYGTSSDLVLQLVRGTRADVFASDDHNDMVKAEQAELVDGKPVDIAGGSRSIAVVKDAGNPDLAKKFVALVTGQYGQKVLSEAG